MKLVASLLTIITLIVSCNSNSDESKESSQDKRIKSLVADKENECCAFMEGDACFCETQSIQENCDCDTITSLSVLYLGEAPAQFIKIFTSNSDHLCKFNNLYQGDEITCNPLLTSFTALTTFKIKTNYQVCTGYMDTSCDGDSIINSYVNGCDDIVVTGYVGDGHQICEDGFEPCTCNEDDSASTPHKLQLYIPAVPEVVDGETANNMPETLGIDDDMYADIVDSSDDFSDPSAYESAENKWVFDENQVKTALYYDMETTDDASDSEEISTAEYWNDENKEFVQKTMAFGMSTTATDDSEERSTTMTGQWETMYGETTRDYASDGYGDGHNEDKFMEITDLLYGMSSDSSYSMSDSSLSISSDSSHSMSSDSSFSISSDWMSKSVESSGTKHVHDVYNNFVDVPNFDVQESLVLDTKTTAESSTDGTDDGLYDVNKTNDSVDRSVLFTPVIGNSEGKIEANSYKKTWGNWMYSTVSKHCSFYSILVVAILNVMAVGYCICIRPTLLRKMKKYRIRMERLSEREVDSSLSELDENSEVDEEANEC